MELPAALRRPAGPGVHRGSDDDVACHRFLPGPVQRRTPAQQKAQIRQLSTSSCSYPPVVGAKPETCKVDIDPSILAVKGMLHYARGLSDRVCPHHPHAASRHPCATVSPMKMIIKCRCREMKRIFFRTASFCRDQNLGHDHRLRCRARPGFFWPSRIALRSPKTQVCVIGLPDDAHG